MNIAEAKEFFRTMNQVGPNAHRVALGLGEVEYVAKRREADRAITPDHATDKWGRKLNDL